MIRKNGPWTITDTQIKYKNPWIEVREDAVVRPDGKPGIFGVVRMKPGVSVLALDADDQVYLTDEFHYAIGARSLEVVSGGIDEGEDPLEAAKRELKEELGIEAGTWTPLGVVNPFTTVVESPAHLFLATDLSFGPRQLEGTEDITAVRVPMAEALQMAMDGRVTHGPSCTLILKAAEFLRKKR